MKVWILTYGVDPNDVEILGVFGSEAAAGAKADGLAAKEAGRATRPLSPEERTRIYRSLYRIEGWEVIDGAEVCRNCGHSERDHQAGDSEPPERCHARAHGGFCGCLLYEGAGGRVSRLSA